MVMRLLCALLASGACWLAPSAAVAGPALLYDATTRQVLYAEDADHVWYPASLTKLMTAYIVFETWKAGKAAPTDRITISARANSRPKVRLGLGAARELSRAPQDPRPETRAGRGGFRRTEVYFENGAVRAVLV